MDTIITIEMWKVKKMIQENIKSNELDGAELLREWIEDSGVISDLGFPYPLRIRVYLKGDSMYLDEILEAPWQVGGNGGHVRSLRRLSEEEYSELLRDKK